MATAEQYAQWLVDNESKKGTSEFDTVAQAYKSARTQFATPAQPKPEEPGFFGRLAPALSRGFGELGESAAGIGLGLKSAVGANEAAGQQAAEIRKEQAVPKKEAPAISWEELEKTYGKEGAWEALKKLPSYVAEQVLQSAPSMAVPLAAGAAAGAVSGPFAPIAAPLAGIGTYGLQQFGSFMQRQAQEGATGETLAPGKAALASAITSPIGYFADRLTLGLGKVPEKILGEQITKELAKRTGATVAGRAVTGATVGVIAEAPTEVLEQMSERWQAGLPLTDEQAKKEYKEAFFGAAAVGGLGGGVSRAIAKPQAEVTPPAITPPITAPEAPTETPIQQQIAATTGINEAEAPVTPPSMLTSEEAANQRMPMLQAKVEEDMAAQEERARREGPRPVVPEVVQEDVSRFDNELPKVTSREDLLAKQAEIDQMRLDAGLPTGESSLTPGVQPEVKAPEEVLTPKIVDNRPLQERAANNRLLVMQNMLQNQGGDPASLTIVPHPSAEGRFAIQSLDVPARFTPEMQGNKNETGRVRETTVTRMDETGKPFTETTETPAGPGIEIDPIKTYIEIARKTNTPASMRLVRDFDAGLVTRDDVQAAIDAEHKAGRPLPLNYTSAGTPWFLAPEVTKPRGERELPTGSTLTPPLVGPELPPVTKPAAQVHAEVAGGTNVPPVAPPTIGEPPVEPPTGEAPPETPTGEAPPPPTGVMPKNLDEFKQLMPVSRNNPEYAVANKAGNFKQLADIMAASKNPAIKRIGELSRGIANKVILHKPGHVGQGVAGVFRYADNSIQMAKSHADDEHTNAHESLHALVARAQRYPNERQAPIAADIKKLYLYSKKILIAQGIDFYGLTNEREFTAEAMTNPDFQFALMQIPYPGSRSAWTQFVRLVADLLGIKDTNALTEVMNLTDKLARVKQTRSAAEKGATEFDTVEGVTPQERETNFKRWSYDLPVYDSLSDDNPSDRGVYRVYHATRADFKEFIPGGLNPKDSGPATWLSPYADYQAAVFRTGNEKSGFREGTNVMPLYARVASPLVIDDKGMLKWAQSVYGDSEFPQLLSQKTVDLLKADGYDAIVFKGEKLGWGKHSDEIIVFDPTQLKSATGNRGKYNPEDADIEAMQMPSFGKKPEVQTPTNVGQQAIDIVGQTGMAAAPPPLSKTEVAKQVIAKLRENPALTAQTAKAALQRAMDQFETSMFSGDAAFNNEIRRNLMKDFADHPEILGKLLDASQSQTLHSDAVATQFIIEGGVAYEKETNKWVAIKKEDNFIKLAKNIEALQSKYNITKENAERIAHTYFVAKRFKSLVAKQAERNAEIASLESRIQKEKNNSKLTAAQRESIVKGLRSDIKKIKDAEVYISDEQRAMIQPGMSLVKLMPELEQISDTWQGIRVNAIKAMVDGGLWNLQTAEAMLDNIDYVPFYREEQLEEGQGPQEFIKGLEVKAKEYKLKGSNSAVNDVFDNMVRWTQYAINRSLRNHKAVQMIDLGTEIKVGDEKMAKKVEKMDKDKNIVRVYRHGVQELYEMADPLYMDAFTAISNVAIPHVKFFSTFANMLRQSVVLYPLFSVAQVPQDAYAAMFSSGLKMPYALTIPARAVKEFVKTLNKTSATHNLLKQYGATGVRDFNATIARQDVEIAAGLKAPKGLKGKILEGLSNIAMASDNAVRQAVYEAAIAQGMSKSEALEKAFEIINFRRRGTSKTVNFLGQTVPFFYAYMSVSRTAFKTLSGIGISPQEKKEAWKTLAYTSSAVMALSMLYVMANGGDEEYEKTPVAVRDRTLHVPGTTMRIPLRPDFFLFPKIITEHAYHMITDDGLTDGAKFRKSMADTLGSAVLSPQPIPQAIKPLFEAAINHDFFQGRPIVGEFEQKKEVTRQFNENTSELSKILSHVPLSYSAQRNQFEGISPIVLDHVIRGMFGTVGGLTLYASNFLLHSDPNVDRPTMSFQEAMAALPGTSGFVTRPNESRLKNDFYELRDVVEKANSTYQDIKKRSPEGIDDFIQDEKNMMRVGLVKNVEHVTRQISQIRNAIAQISNAPKDVFTGDEKDTRIKELRTMEAEMMKSIPVGEMRKIAKM